MCQHISREDVDLWSNVDWWGKHLDGFIGVGDEGDEEAEHHVDEEGDEWVEVDPAEQPHQVRLVPHGFEGSVHVVPVDEREETLCHLVQGPELEGDSDGRHWGYPILHASIPVIWLYDVLWFVSMTIFMFEMGSQQIVRSGSPHLVMFD